jgi:NADPH-dependent ferric siderophore reductase
VHGEVLSTHRLGSHLVRVVLGGPGLAGFASTGDSDEYVNCFFLPAAAAYTAPFDDDAVRALPREQRPHPRRMTVRRWDAEAGELTLDIASHGDVGHAGRWAAAAVTGDCLQLRGPAGGYRPHPDADAYLLVGDESALPAIAACAEAVPAGRPVTAVVEVEDGAGEIPLDSPGDLDVHWVHRAGREHELDTLLSDAVAALPRPSGSVSAFVHGEAAATRAVRRHLLEERIVTEDRLSCSPYWRRGLDDEQWRTVKADWLRSMAGDVAAP